VQAFRSLLFLLSLWSLTAGAQDFWVGSFYDDGEEVQHVPHGLGGVPKALFIWSDGLTDPMNHRGAALTWSLCDADRCVGWAGDRIRAELEDGEIRQRSRRVTHLEAVHFIDGARAELVGWDAERLSFRWNGEGAPGRIHILAIGGEGTRARVVDWNLPASAPTGRVEVSGVGFEPDVLLSLTSDQSLTSIPERQSGMSLKMSVATAEGLEQWTTGTATNVSGDSLVARWLLHGNFIAGGSMSTFPVHLGRLERMTADGFVVDFPVSSGVPGAVATLALSGVRAQAGRIEGPSEVGGATQRFTGMRFRPQAMLFRSVQSPPRDGPWAGASLGLGMSDGVNSFVTAFREAPLGSFAKAWGQGSVHLGLYDGVSGGRAGLQALTDTGFDLLWEDHAGVPVELAWLALATRDAASPEIRFTRQPVDGEVGGVLEAVEVTVTSESGAPATGVPVRLTLVGGEGVGLHGTLEVLTVEGVARFSDLVIDGEATHLRLRAQLPDGLQVESDPFSVLAAAPGTGHYRVACGCGADGSAALGWGTLLVALWGMSRRPRRWAD